MNFLILGDGAEELAWLRRIVEDDEQRVVAAFPGFDEFPDIPGPADLDDALATPGVEAVVVGGGLEFRAEALRRVAAAGWPAICLHPPGPDAEPYYVVALSREETGATIVPDLPERLHPGVERIRSAIATQELGPFRELRYEAPARVDLVGEAFARMVDLVRSLLGEIDALTATGDPPGEHPTASLVVHLRDAKARRAEVRTWVGPPEPARLLLLAAQGSVTLEFDPDEEHTSRLIRRTATGGEEAVDLPPWDSQGEILAILGRAVGREDVHPSLLDGTRAMELVEAVHRSLRRGRTVELHYEEISEEASFKSVMTSTGCTLLMAVLVVLPLALVGPAFGMGWTLYLAYAVLPILILFIVLQSLRFAVRKRS